MHDKVIETLTALEAQHGVEILFAVESGSRAWGFASPDSDYDVRFVYRQPLSWHLDLRERRDTIEGMYPDAIDCSGWELRKALRLMAGSNASFLEWLHSPIRYQVRGHALEEMRALAGPCFHPRRALHHYLGTARSMLRAFPIAPPLPIKKLFYILRPLAAGVWIAREGVAPPVPFIALCDEGVFPDPVLVVVHELLDQKRIALEADQIETPALVKRWIEETMARLEAVPGASFPSVEPPWALLNRYFRESLG